MPYKIIGSCIHKADTGEKVDCADSPEAAQRMMRAMYASEGSKMKFTPEEELNYGEYLQAKAYIDTHDIKGVTETSDGDVIIPVSAVRFSDAQNKDLHKEFFDKQTNFGHPAATEVIPVYLDHGYDKIFIARELISLGYTEKEAKDIAEEIGVGRNQQGVALRANVDDENIYYNVIVNRRNRYKNLLKRLAEEKLIAPSTGVKFRSAKSQDGYIADWHLGELTLTPSGAEPNIGVTGKMAEENVTNTTPPAATPPPEEPKKEETPEENPLVAKFHELFPNKIESTTVSDVLMKLMEKMDAVLEDNKALRAEVAQVNKMVGQTHEVMPLIINKMAEAMVPAVADQMKMANVERDVQKTYASAATTPKPTRGLPAGAPGATR